MIRIPTITTALALATMTPALADEALELCDITPAEFEAEMLPKLVGSWTANNLNGQAVMTAEGMAMPVPMPPEPSEPVDIVLHGDNKLTAVNWASNSDEEVDLVLVNGKTLLDAAADFIPGNAGQFSDLDATSAAGCDITTYPHLFASGTRGEDGSTLTWTGTFVVISSDNMIGAMKFELTGNAPGRIDGYRSVTLTR